MVVQHREQQNDGGCLFNNRHGGGRGGHLGAVLVLPLRRRSLPDDHPGDRLVGILHPGDHPTGIVGVGAAFVDVEFVVC
jgi:hypothetical protein